MQENDWTKKADEELKKAAEAQDVFFKTEYKKISKNDRINYWASHIRQQFRWNEESGIDGYLIFSKEDYEMWQQVEPEIDELLPHIAEKIKLSIDRIKKAITF